METTSIRSRAGVQAQLRGVDWSAVWTWLLCFGLVAYLGMKGGGFDPLVHDQVGIAVWWIALVGVVVGAFPMRRQGRLAWVGLGLLAAFVAWTALSLIWTESVERTSADLARVATYLGVFALALLSRDTAKARRLVAAIAAAIAFVSIVALLSRLHPAWFHEADQTGLFLPSSRERLSYPLDYWNALAALGAIGLPLLLQLASGATRPVARVAAAAAIPALALTIFFTLSRAGSVGAVVGLVVFLAFASDRLPKLATALVSGAGGAVLIAAAASRHALRHGAESATAHHQGNEMLALTVVVCLLVGAAQLGISRVLLGERRPAWASVSRRQALALAAVAAVALVVAAVALDAPGRAADGWAEFKRGDQPGGGAGRLGSAAGESRYQFWSAAVRENASNPPIGTGSGTFQFWWARDGDVYNVVRDTHSLYLQTLGELGIVGMALLGAFLLAVLVGGGRAALRADPSARSTLAAALAGCAVFCFGAVFDWLWQMPVLPVAMLLLGSVLVGRSARDAPARARLPLSPRLAFAAFSLVAIVVIATPLASTSLVRQSTADVRRGDLPAALRAARGAENAEPGAAAPRLQQALVLEEQGELAPAAEAALAATERESTNWRTWMVLSRIEAERGDAGNAVRDYRRARSLNPRSPIFAGG